MELLEGKNYLYIKQQIKRITQKNKINPESIPSIQEISKNEGMDPLLKWYVVSNKIWNDVSYRRKNKDLIKFILTNSSLIGINTDSFRYLMKKEKKYVTEKIKKRFDLVFSKKRIYRDKYYLITYYFPQYLKMYNKYEATYKMINCKDHLKFYSNLEVNDLKYFVACNTSLFVKYFNQNNFNKNILNIFICEYKRVLKKFLKMNIEELREIICKEENKNLDEILKENLNENIKDSNKINIIKEIIKIMKSYDEPSSKVFKNIFKIHIENYPENYL